MRKTERQLRSAGYKVGYRHAMRDALEKFRGLQPYGTERPALEAFRKRMKRAFAVRMA